MTPEVVAAAERLIELHEPRLSKPHLRGESDELIVKVARAYLAENPADDAEPITAEWLEACGFTQEIDAASFAPDKRTWSVCIEGGSNYASLPDQFTRGQLRRLAEALGIELRKETP